MHGNLDVAPTGMRFLIALVFAWIGITLLAMVVGGYGSQAGAAADASEPNELEAGTLDE